MEDLQNYLNSIRRDFADKPFDENSISKTPSQQFQVWFEEAVNSQILDPYAMSLSTVNKEGQPSTRIVYMRNISEEGFTFYTNYDSDKGKDITENNKVSLNFLWGALERQIRINGVVEKVSDVISDEYFAGRPRESKIGAWASSQSEELESREQLEEKVTLFTNKFKDQEVPRPKNWGGYIVRHTQIEFWQGRSNRLHDRLLYIKSADSWKIKRLSP